MRPTLRAVRQSTNIKFFEECNYHGRINCSCSFSDEIMDAKDLLVFLSNSTELMKLKGN